MWDIQEILPHLFFQEFFPLVFHLNFLEHIPLGLLQLLVNELIFLAHFVIFFDLSIFEIFDEIQKSFLDYKDMPINRETVIDIHLFKPLWFSTLLQKCEHRNKGINDQKHEVCHREQVPRIWCEFEIFLIYQIFSDLVIYWENLLGGFFLFGKPSGPFDVFKALMELFQFWDYLFWDFLN